MKTIYKTLAAVAVATPMLLSTGCIEETFPTSGVTSEQVSQNSKGIDGIVQGMPAFMKKYNTWSSQAFNFGYPSFFIMMNVQTQDMIQNYTGYQHFTYWQSVMLSLNSGYLLSQINWYYLNFQVRAANDVLTAVGTPNSDFEKTACAQALIYRASTYLDMARVYEFKPNADISGVNEDGNDVTGLTVPVITPDATPEEQANNPRLKHDDMVAFLLKDLQTAIDYYDETGESPSAKVYPSKAVALGVMARVYEWDEDYAKAAEYARKAIDASGATPLTQAQWLSTTQGFNDSSFSSWMWSIQMESNDDPVQGSTNWMSFMSPEANIGYGGQYGAYFMIDKSLYEQISNADFRKLVFKAPAGHPLSGREQVLNPSKYNSLEPYTSFKFRPGQGNLSERPVAFAVAIPLMRVEEMYFIEAEAKAHQNVAEGKSAIEAFMKQYRYPTYTCTATSQEDVINEIVLQKRIEFWGENTTFFDMKRLDMGVTRAYEDTNWPEDSRYNTVGRPGWMNWPFVDYEGEFNAGVRGFLNPNVGERFKPILPAEE